MNKRKNFRTAVTLVAGIAPLCALGQAPERQLEEVKVEDKAARYTAGAVQVGTFRDTDPLEVPLTVNVVPRAVLDAQSATSIYDALKNTAGVTRSQLGEGTYDNISIRGILVENRSNYRLNGSLPIVNLIDLPLENKERVEVLKGASGLYFRDLSNVERVEVIKGPAAVLYGPRAAAGEPPEIFSQELLRDGSAVRIRHRGEVYTLRQTSNGKLILTK